ncbi:MAG: LytTR family transcriptional regulator, partial [Oscillospiraceae bacterium]|nr:LytTR family transcriptional regulator [Oscillospiraceae bacterium]
INAFEVEAVDYIIKPVEYYDFAMKFRRAARWAVRRGGRELTLDTVSGIQRIGVADIVYVEALRHYLTYHTRRKGAELCGIEVRGSIGEHEALLTSYGFCRVHKSYLVNLAHIDVIRTSEAVVDGIAIPIGRRYKKELMEKYMQFLR